ncbi:hypothetical protein Tco_0550018, partial [Tanacetum coccineum]
VSTIANPSSKPALTLANTGSLPNPSMIAVAAVAVTASISASNV